MDGRNRKEAKKADEDKAELDGGAGDVKLLNGLAWVSSELELGDGCCAFRRRGGDDVVLSGGSG